MSSPLKFFFSSQPLLYGANLSSTPVIPVNDVMSSIANYIAGSSDDTPECRCMPSDACWPKQDTWDAFNASINGRLIATVAIGSPCHQDSVTGYDATACADLKDKWLIPDTHWTTSSSIMTNYFANASCSPFVAAGVPCTLGGYVSYAVNATRADDYRKTLAFNQKHNIRTVIRNTGHDYYGKSTGAGAVAIWTHFIKDIEFLNYESAHWTGKAVRMGAGVQSQDVNEAAKEHGLVVVTGDCASIAVAGGWAQGGGHSPLSSKYGLGADQVLEWELITAEGEHLIATPTQNEDLYWAMSGGGAGSWGVVLSMTARAYPDETTSFADLTFTQEGISEAVFFDAVAIFLKSAFTVMPATAPGLSQKELDTIFEPILAHLQEHDVKHNYESAEFTGFWDGLNAMRPAHNITNMNWGNRLIPRSVVENQLPGLIQAYRNMLKMGAAIAGNVINVRQTKRPEDPPNAAVPAWRDALMNQVFANAYDETNLTFTREQQNIMTEKLVPELAKLLPSGGNAYNNEGDFQEPNFQHTFYGEENYSRLVTIKNKYDPLGVFYGLTSVGSESWYSTADGRLCRRM